MANYRLSNVAKEDLIRIHHYGTTRFGAPQADKYFDSFFKYFEIIAQRPYSFEAVDFIRPGYRRCVCGSDSIYYRVKDEVIEIMTIIGRQDIEDSFNKLDEGKE
ncbi:MAG: type II toxin-antitoxin system RelE/ParE family toxin [Fulvivirga sp.]|uniref:type II toxin-antitoxin system RelE/ParE family toxin n=1 Tax=Fulvivirga sp. TaxID=1931237 RepID=UPI0032EED581